MADIKDRNREPHEQPRVVQSEAIKDHHLGVLSLPNGNKLACRCFVFHMEYEPDWLEFFLPLGSIGRFYSTGGFPFGPSAGYTDWQREIDLALVEVARHLYRQVPFRAGLIDFEVDVNDLEELYWELRGRARPGKTKVRIALERGEWSGMASA